MRSLPHCARVALSSASALAMTLSWASVAAAQDADQPDVSSEGDPQAEGDQIIVTGTLLSGIAPVGTNVVSISEADVVATGAVSANDLLATIPQISNFNTIPTGGANFGQPIVQTNLRNLGASGGTTTLVLMNGHRMVGQGILQTYVDPQVIPPGIIERVEVIPDGGSSIYGSDAIGGVINFITKKRFTGLEAVGRYGFADGYETVDGNVTAGTQWGSGGVSLSYSYAWHSNIQGGERDYVTQDHREFGGTDNRSFNCTPGNIRIGQATYPLPSMSGAPNRCDTSDVVDIYPRETRHAVFATLDQELSDAITTNLTAYYSRRDTKTTEATLAGSGTIRNTNPYFIPGPNGETSYNVIFDFAPVFGKGVVNPQRFDSWGVTPTIEVDVGSDWSVRGLLNYGHSWNNTIQSGINGANVATALAGTTRTTALNPYNLGATDPGVLYTLRDRRDYAAAKQDLAEARLVADGPIFALPAGDVRLAVGAEYHWEKIAADIEFGRISKPFANSAEATRNVKSLFGEIFVPVFDMLDLTGSVRYDHYDDVGDTTNPKVGFNFRPVDGVTIRGNYGTSFHAPSLADTVGAVDARISHGFFFAYAFPRHVIWISGGSPDLKPETAKSWSIGADVTPTFFPSLTLSATYYNLDFTDIISVNPGGFFGSFFYLDPANAPFFIRNPTIDQVNNYSGGLPIDTFSSLEDLYATFGTPYSVIDVRRYNRGRLKQDGIDFQASLNHPTEFGSINATVGGTYTLNRNTSAANDGVYVDQLLNGTGRLNFLAALGATIGPVTGRAQFSHRGGYPILFNAFQDRVDAYETVDLFLSWDLGDLGVAESTQLTLNVDNVFNTDPPPLTVGTGFANGNTFGRLVQLGLRTRF